MDLDHKLDLAVVGAGVSGTYCACRLQQAMGAAGSIGLFEYSDRIGGRLYSVTLPGLPHISTVRIVAVPLRAEIVTSSMSSATVSPIRSPPNSINTTSARSRAPARSAARSSTRCS